MMKLVYRVYIVSLVLLSLAFAVSAQTTGDKNLRSAKDDRNTAPTVGTGGPVGGPTGLFTVYDGQTLRAGEYTFSAAYSNFDRDPGNADFTEVPVSFQIGVTNNVELFFNTDAYRAVKVNSPNSLSSFYLPNSRINGIRPAAIVMGPTGQAVYRPASLGFTQFPFTTVNPTAGNNGADNFPGVGSVYGSILPGIVLQTGPVVPVVGGPTITVPTSFSTAPTYLPDAPFINRTFGESSFSTMTAGGKFRFTNINNPVGLGVIAYYRYYMDRADDFSGFNQMQRGASPGSSRGDIGVTAFGDARVAKWMNISANVGYNWNGDVKGDFPGGTYTMLDRPDELLLSVGLDFPVNRYFQPIIEGRSLQYIGGRTPNALENDPYEAIAGVRIFPARWVGFSFAYRYHANQQSYGSFSDSENTFAGSVFVPCAVQGEGGCVPYTAASTGTGAPRGFLGSTDPHGYIFQAFIGRRNKRQEEIVNQFANVTALTLSSEKITLPCPAGKIPAEGQACNDSTSINVSTTAVDPENDVLTYNYTVSGGRIVGSGANVSWDLSGQPAGTYTITAGVDDGCGLCGKTETKTVTVADCVCRDACDCGTLTVSGPAGITNPGGSMTFTANLSGGTATDVTYNWSVSAGTIESGQGTPSITVSTTPDMAGSNVTATVNIGGIDPACGCTTEASEIAGVADKPDPVQTDEFGKLANDQIRGRLDTFFAELSNDPTATGYIINYGSPREVATREKLIRNHIAFRKFDASRITIVNGGDQGTGINTKLYRVPSSAENPQP